MKELVIKAEKLLEKCGVCSVASVSEAGYPRICMLAKLKAEGIKSLWFSTGASGTKVKHFRTNTKAGVTFYDEWDSVTLTGTMEIVNDMDVKQIFWKDWTGFLSNHFSGADDPDYALIKFTADEATIFVSGEFETINL